MNALKHGLTAKTLLFPNESSVQFAEILDAYHDCLRPQNQIEAGLVAQLAAARWRLHRIWRYETAVLDLEMDAAAPEFEKKFEHFDEVMRGAEAFSTLANQTNTLSNTLRFDKRVSRAFHRILEELRRLQAAGKKDNSKTNSRNP